MNDPTVPLDQVMPHTAQIVLLVTMIAGAVASIVYAVRESARRRDLALIWLLIGAGISIYYEPLGDALVKVYYSEHGQIGWIDAFGRSIPAFIGILYFWYLPIGTYVLLRWSERGISARLWWATWTGFLAFAVGFEMAVTSIGGPAWTYHGPQAFKVADVPVLTPFTYISFVVGIGMGVWALARWLPARRQWLIVPAVPMLMTASHAATSMPLAIALYSGTSSTSVIAIGALGSAGLAILLSWIGSQMFRRPWPTTPSASVSVLRSDLEAVGQRA
jgi:hypothetical protein